MTHLLTWLYVRFLRDYVMADLLITRMAQRPKVLYVVHLVGDQALATEEKPDQPVRWN